MNLIKSSLLEEITICTFLLVSIALSIMSVQYLSSVYQDLQVHVKFIVITASGTKLKLINFSMSTENMVTLRTITYHNNVDRIHML